MISLSAGSGRRAAELLGRMAGRRCHPAPAEPAAGVSNQHRQARADRATAAAAGPFKFDSEAPLDAGRLPRHHTPTPLRPGESRYQ